MKKILLAVAVLVMVSTILTSQSQATDKIRCEGIPDVSMNITWGILYADVGYGNWDLCSVRETRYSIDIETCKILHKSLLLAEADEKKVKFSFEILNGESCNDVGDWGEPNLFPYHINFSKE